MMEPNFSSAAFIGAPVRAAELQYIVDRIRRGDCCAVVGPSNTGKSYLLRSLTLPEVRQRCARNGIVPVVVFVDCLEAGGSEQAFYELLLRRTLEELEENGAGPSIIGNLQMLHNQLLQSVSDVAVRSIYARAARYLGHEEEINLVLILDEFYDVYRHLRPWPFRQLRALYDALQTKICFVTVTSHHLDQLRSDEETYEFQELFHLHTLVLRPLLPDDAIRFLEYLVARQGDTLSEENITTLVRLSGGHPGLMERLYATLKDQLTAASAPLKIKIPQLMQRRPIQKECHRLWSEIEAEQEPLLTLASKGAAALTRSQRRLLETKGLVIDKAQQGITIFSPVFEAYVAQELADQSQPEQPGIHCDFDTGQIWVDDQEMTLQLSEPQRQLVTFLCQKEGAICTYDEIAESVWGVGEGVSPGAIYELVKRVRQKIESDWKNPRYIITVPGKGYRLEDGQQ